MSSLDRIDRVLLAALQNNARLSNKELAARAGLAPSSCLMRVRKLEAEGVIEGYGAQLDPKALGLGLQAMISVQLRVHTAEGFGSIGAHLRSLPETAAVYCLGGASDFLVHVVCRDTDHLRRLTNTGFMSRPEVDRIETSLVFSYSRSSLPVDEPAAPRPAPVPAERPRSRRRARARR